MANQNQKLIPSQPEDTQNRVILMSNSKKDCNGDSKQLSNSLPLLPYDIIIYDILTRLPIDSLMRFKCVCKSWSNLTINDPEFINLHSRRQTYSNRGFIWLSENYYSLFEENYYSLSEDEDDADDDHYLACDSNFNSIVFFDFDKKEEKVFHFRAESGLFDKRLIIQDSLNGLVLLSCQHTKFRSYHVYNPITGYSYKLPIRNAFVRGYGDNLDFHLVYDPDMEKYKVLCICLSLCPPRYSLKIITLGTGNDSWREVDFPKMHPCFDNFTQVFANGSYYWLTYEKEILSIDVCNEVFHTIKYPNGGSTRSRLFEIEDSSKLLEIQGSLGFLDYTDNALQVRLEESVHIFEESTTYKGKLNLWILKEDGEKKKNRHQQEWIQMYNIVDMFHNTVVPRTFFHLGSSTKVVAVVMHPTPKIIFGVSTEEFGEDGEYYSYDVKLKRLDSTIKPYVHNKWYVSSLTRL
ncbi:hypothetical protein MKW92_006364 [Papaver armeniacum]|nr:hypothetical protein MKW92_006364 [Papaver armeniacum]